MNKFIKQKRRFEKNYGHNLKYISNFNVNNNNYITVHFPNGEFFDYNKYTIYKCKLCGNEMFIAFDMTFKSVNRFCFGFLYLDFYMMPCSEIIIKQILE
jgi:hypothetical protein